jgi:hypothetical protein
MAAGEADRRADAVGVEERSAVKVPSHEEAVQRARTIEAIKTLLPPDGVPRRAPAFER